MVPESYIKKNEEINAVRELEEPLNRDVVDHVLKFVNPYISLSDTSEEDHVKSVSYTHLTLPTKRIV